MRRYYITDRRRCPLDLLDCIERNARQGIDWLQIREKDLPPHELLELVRSALARTAPHGTHVLVNDRLDVALAAGAHGVHLPSDAPAVSALRGATPAGFLIAVSTHTADELQRAEREGADLAVFGPVFPTASKPGRTAVSGLDGLQKACRGISIPVAALGGVTLETAPACVAAGAAGVAGISMFQSETARDPGGGAGSL